MIKFAAKDIENFDKILQDMIDIIKKQSYSNKIEVLVNHMINNGYIEESDVMKILRKYN